MYAASKLAAEILLKSYASLMDVAVLRLFGVYGPGQTNAMLPGLIDRFVSGAEISLAGNEGVRFNPIHVEDCARVLCHLLSEPALRGFNALNVGGSEVVSLRDAVDIFEAQTGRQARVRVTDEAPKHLVGSTEKLDRMGGGGRRVSFRDGLIGMMSRQLARN
jgi:nucleoside-diphosphate-sugar epimerase